MECAFPRRDSGQCAHAARCRRGPTAIGAHEIRSLTVSAQPFVDTALTFISHDIYLARTASLRFPLFFLETRGGDLASEL